jgi:hypothetical protein
VLVLLHHVRRPGRPGLRRRRRPRGRHRYLKAAERSEALWEGTAWQASLVEIRAHIARAEHREDQARRLFDDAAALFDDAGQPLDAQRCRA